MNFRRLSALLLSVAVTTSAFAFNFTGKTFRAEEENPDGSKISITISFRSGNRATSTVAVTGQKSTSASLWWEVSGDFITFTEVNTGAVMYLQIDEDCDDDGPCETVLVGTDDYGNAAVYFYQVKTTTTPKTSGKKATRKKR